MQKQNYFLNYRFEILRTDCKIANIIFNFKQTLKITGFILNKYLVKTE